MRKHLLTCVLALLVGVLGFAVSGIAVAGNGKPPSPPGQGDCEHGNAAKPCKDDPQPDKGKDCQAHGNKGGVDEDHCKEEETTPTDTTPSETTPTETTPTDTIPTDTTPSGTTPADTTPSTTTSSNSTTPSSTVPQETTTAESTPAETTPSEGSTVSPPSIVGTPPVAHQASAKPRVRGITANEPKPTTKEQQAPFTL